jgi:hypothetical protein
MVFAVLPMAHKAGLSLTAFCSDEKGSEPFNLELPAKKGLVTFSKKKGSDPFVCIILAHTKAGMLPYNQS